ncbi:MAG: YggS family pyridoxal phosphate-dependent enzyme [Cyclobacteriaceae bacterium]
MKGNKNIDALKAALPAHVTLIAVSKTQPANRILEVYSQGHHQFGENKAQELTRKYNELPKDIEWHMIGHLQTNKVKYIAPFVHLIHSVDSLKLLQEINKQAERHNRVIPVLLQVHIASEETKFGFSEAEVEELIRNPELETLKHVRIKGLMGMATFTSDEEKIRREFKTLKSLFEKLKPISKPGRVEMHELSMGMSNDYPIAIEEGSTMIRIGSAIFGERKV